MLRREIRKLERRKGNQSRGTKGLTDRKEIQCEKERIECCH